MEHPYGYIRENKVFLKGFMGQADRQIGEVKEDEASTLKYFEARYDLLRDKVEKLKTDIQENENKGSFLMKLIHLRDSLMKADALGDFIPLIEELNQEESLLNEIILGNRAKNLETKTSLIAEAEELKDNIDWKETTEEFKELKLRWIKTGPVEKEKQEEIERQFEAIVQHFFENRKHFFEGLALQADENIKTYESLVEQARDAHDFPDVKMAFEISKKIQRQWKESGKVPAERRQPLWDEFSKLNNRIFSKYKRTLNPGPTMHPREVMQKVETLTEEIKQMASKSTSNELISRAKGIQEEWRKLPERKPKEANLIVRSFQFFSDIVFEKAFLEKLVHGKYEDFDDKTVEEQTQIKIALIKDLLRRDQTELEAAQANSENFRVQSADFDIMMKKKLFSVKRKVDVKNYILKQLSFK
jgi:cellobiose-specific phosphotransferase system component IIA